MKKRKAQEQIRTHKPFEPLLYLAPFFLGVIIFTLYPFIRIILISFMEDYKYISHTFSSIGLGNYTKIFSDPYFHSALKNTGIYVLWVVPLSLCLGLCIAVLLNRNIKLQGLSRPATFCPSPPPSRLWVWCGSGYSTTTTVFSIISCPFSAWRR